MLLAVAFGAGLTVILATRFGFPISTTHGLTGALVGAGFLAVGRQVNLAMLGKAFVLPLFLSPVLAIALGGLIYLLFRWTRLRLHVTKELCICVGAEKQVIPLPQPSGVLAAQALPAISMAIDSVAACDERYAGHCPCCGGITLAPVPVGLEDSSPFSANIVALAIYLRFTHAISYRRLTQVFLHLFALPISEGALDAMLQRAKPCFDNAVAAILARLRRSRIVGFDETTVRIDGRTHWNWVFQNDQVVIHVVRDSRATSVLTAVMAGHRPVIWVSDLYSAQQGHADLWQVCLAHQLRDCQYAIDAGDTVFAPRMKMLLLRAVVLARRRKNLAASTRRAYLRRLDHDLNAIMGVAPGNAHGKRLRKRYGKVRNSLFTFLEHPDAPPDNNASERELRPTATYRKVTGGFRSSWGADLFAAVRSVVGTAARRGLDAYQAIRAVLDGESVVLPG